jgi:hypothetical protein
LLPFREEFSKPFTRREYRSRWGKGGPTAEGYKSWEEEVKILPDDLEYDKHVEERMEELYKYNRVMFLIQGLLDRSEVFQPHPLISLADPDHLDLYFRAIFDEEDGLPSANPPVWETYRDALNACLVPGNYVYSKWHPESDYEYSHRGEGRWVKNARQRPAICEVTEVKRDRTKVKVSWAYGQVYGWHPHPTKPGWRQRGYYEPDKKKHCWIPIKEVFNVSAYKTGDYKQFLCDAYQKGRYLEWAPQLLGAEKWLKLSKAKQKVMANDPDSNIHNT